MRQGIGRPRFVFHARCPIWISTRGVAAVFSELPVPRSAATEQRGGLCVVRAVLDRIGRGDAAAEAARPWQRRRATAARPGRGSLNMKWQLLATLGLAIFAFSSQQITVAADDPPDGPKRIFRSEE